MRPWTFRLAGVLSLWRRREDAAFALLQRESAAFAEAQARVWDRRTGLTDARAAGARALATATRSDDLAWHRNWITHLAQQLAAAQQEAARCEAREAAARTAWRRARRDRRVIERLRDRAARRHAAAERAAETKQMDELAGLRAPKGQAQ